MERNTEITIKMKKDEDSEDAITRYMKKNGYTFGKWTDGKGLEHRYYTGPEYSELWISTKNVNGNKVTFELNGNR